MRTTLLYGPGDVRFEEAPDPVIRDPRNAIVRVVASCVCGSDLWRYRGVTGAPKQPQPIGHEFIGIVEEVGSDVSRVRVGDFVIAPFYDCDFACVNCRNGYSTSCLEVGWWGRRITRASRPRAARVRSCACRTQTDPSRSCRAGCPTRR